VRLARHWGMSSLLVGAVVVGMGTSLPELFVSISGGLDSFDLGVGNITGSNIANLTLVLGVAVIISPVGGSASLVRQEGLLTFVAMALFGTFLWDGTLSRFEGVVLLVAMVVALYRLFHLESTKKDALEAVQEIDETEGHVWAEIGIALATLAATLLGADWLTDGALIVADEFGLSEGFVGNTLVAIGTSLPELAAGVAAARRRENDLILGNLLGSNVFNSLLVAGALGVTTAGTLVEPAQVTIGFMMGAIVLAGLFAARDSISRLEGMALLGTYGAFIWLGF
jgi:cation:H+ antiporter